MNELKQRRRTTVDIPTLARCRLNSTDHYIDESDDSEAMLK